MGTLEDALQPVGSTLQESFALMLHDRVVELERAVTALAPRPLDPAITLLGTDRAAATGAAFVRIRSALSVETHRVASRILASLGGGDATRWDAWCCQHWSCLLHRDPYVFEMVVQRSGTDPLHVDRVAHAALDSMRELLRPFSLHHTVGVEACACKCPAWFVESIRTACVAVKQATLYTWDPRAETVVASDVSDIDETGTQDASDHRAWVMLHGWLASQVDVTDVWHPRALSATAHGLELVGTLRRLLI